ncbi:hypothetical protein EYF80_028705 [Liparis tanakae]|uniref:Uncharacterized protein n=1 Tax=Liparis tanakae TaxID=230148 RepID=A0A4Z2H8G0_9TELE|nr:hypothetical protein EYF80_028705 [Liparis tanakae]
MCGPTAGLGSVLRALRGILTASGASSSRAVAPEAEACRAPGMQMGSGATVRVLRTAGASGPPQSLHAKPRN